MTSLAYSVEKRRTYRPSLLEQQLLLIYEDCSSLVQRRAAHIVGIDAVAQDIAQQVFIHVLNELNAGAVIRTPRAFCFRAATNLALNWLRDTRRQEELLAERYCGERFEQPQTEGELFVRQLFARCNADDALVAAHHHLEGKDRAEIARLLGISRRTVGRSLARFATVARSAVNPEALAQPADTAARIVAACA